ncbi:hypothetical protein [Halopiger xanaduensis]|uniref:Uncharacterized protein n=1 Tax=Halopiger xanaduensis (strain DSM 18323 / JCM 14033 / SH-6) TaxID=797210 RepID=F8D8P4_HALXS|nr:hypothetical protein [Halopiger xanaduensis]AEH36802.1 hypothetical protein Halxa_2177 [Halopiger xanaduensis SH-6]
MAQFTDDDRGKPVENANGDRVGTIETVEGDVAHVRPNADAVDSIKSSIGWESRADETLPLTRDRVADVTDDAVRLEGELLEQMPDGERDESEPEETTNRGLSADPSEMTDDASGFEVNPDDLDDEFRRDDAAADPDEDAERSDAAVNPDDVDDRTDADADADEDAT